MGGTMTRKVLSNLWKILFGVLIIVLIAIAIMSIPQSFPTSQIEKTSVTEAYPPPLPTEAKGFQAPTSYPVFSESPTPQNTPRPTVAPEATKILPTPTSEVNESVVFTPFPTPQFSLLDDTVKIDTLDSLWYPSFLYINSIVKLQQIHLNMQGGRKEKPDLEIDLGFKASPQLLQKIDELYISPSGKKAAVDFESGENVFTKIYDLNTLSEKVLFIKDSNTEMVQFYSWSPNDQYILGDVNDDPYWTVSRINLENGQRENFEYPDWDSSPARIDGMVYSPQGDKIVDSIIYQPVKGSSHDWTLDVGEWDAENFKSRVTLCKIENILGIYKNSLKWSPDGEKLVFVTISKGKSTDSISLVLWVLEAKNKICKDIVQLVGNENFKVGMGAFIPDWSLDGKFLVFQSIDKIDNDLPSSSINLLEFDSGKIVKIYISKEKITHIQFSPDANLISYSLDLGSYGEIWAINLNGIRKIPLAGPTTTDAPFAWRKKD